VRSFMEPRFGREFGGVRVHTDERAERSAESVDALAYTVGDHIVFGRGQYSPDSDPGRHLLAHELTHVLQQWSTASPSNPPVVYRQTPGTAGAASAGTTRQIVKMTLISGRGLMIFELDNGTRESVKLTYNGRPDPGNYTYHYNAKDQQGEILENAGGTRNAD